METTQQVIDVIKTNLAPLAEIAKEQGGYGWELLVKKAFWIDGVMGCFFFLFFIVISTTSLIVGIRRYDSEKREDENTVQIIMSYAGGIVLFFTLIIGLLKFAHCFTGLVIPEYTAIQEILSIAK